MSASPREAVAAMLRRSFFVDLILVLVQAGIWVQQGFVDVGVMLVTSALRSIVWLAYIRHAVGPVQVWLAGERDSVHLQAAHAALISLSRRAGRANVFGWLSVEALWLLLGWFGVLGPLPLGQAELVAATMIGSTLLLTPMFLEPLIDHALGELHEQVGREMSERGFETVSEHAKLSHVIPRLVVGAFISTTVGIAGLNLSESVDTRRNQAKLEQQHQVELSALRVTTGLAPLDGVEIVARDALPSALLSELAQLPEPTTIADYDAREQSLVSAAPLADGRWAVAHAEPDEQLGPSVLATVLMVVLTAPIFWLAAWAYARSIAEPIQRFTATMEGFASHGRLRGLTRAALPRNQEVAALAVGFNHMLDILEQLARAAENVAEGDLDVVLEQPGELQDAFRGMLARLNLIVGRLRETSLELASAAAEIQALTQQQHDAALQQSSGVQQVSATVASLADAAQNIAANANEVLDNAEQTVTMTDAMTERIAELRSHAASVTALLEVIREVAARSDLLALNGSLEATRAGEAGRGFALVAAEMRRLAERVTATIADVRTQVSDIDASGTNTVVATEQSRKLAQETAIAARRISTVTGQQSAETKDVAVGIQQLAETVASFAGAASQTHAAAEGLRVHATELERLLATFRTA